MPEEELDVLEAEEIQNGDNKKSKVRVNAHNRSKDNSVADKISDNKNNRSANVVDINSGSKNNNLESNNKGALNNNSGINDNNIIDFPGNNLDNGYTKAASGREAFQKKLNDKNYFDDSKKRNQDQLNKLREDKKNQQKKTDGASERLKQAKLNNEGKKRSQMTSGEKKELKEAKKENKDEQKKSKDLDRKEKKLEKDNKNIIKDEKKAKRYAITHPIDALKQKLKRMIIMSVVPKALVVFLIIIAFCFILESIFEIFDKINKAGLAVANFHEKLDNYFSGLGFSNSEDAFFDEFDKLNKKYYYQLDKKLLMATIFYDNIQNGMDPDSDETVYGMVDEDSGVVKTLFLTIKNWVRESNETVDDKGLVFTSNKIYRLRLLAKNQFATGLWGLAAKKTTSHTVSLKGYLKEVASMLGSELWEFIKSIPRHIFKVILSPLDLLESIKEIIADDEQLFMTDTGQSLLNDNPVSDLYDILKVIFSGFADVESVSISKCADSFDDIEGEDYDVQTDSDGSSYKRHICVKYKTYERDDESYFQYLRKHYIPKMPEYQKQLKGLSGDEYDERIETIIKEIKQIAEDYEQYFGETISGNVVNSTEYKGNINPTLLKEIQQPVIVPEGFEVSFAPPYGKGSRSDGTIHEGIDLNSVTTGTNEGDSVYSIYHTGKVVESTFDNTYLTSGCTGGCLKIVHRVNIEGEEHDFTVTYSGLDPSSITLKSGDMVGKGDEIGKVGNAEQSEHDIPSVHFTMLYNDTGEYMDPTNLYITPSTIVLYGNNLAEKIWWAFRDAGFSKEATAGVIGNVAVETGNGNIDAIKVLSAEEGKSFEQIMNSDGIGFGLAGWTWKGFKTSFNDYLAYVGGNWYDEDVQIGYLLITVSSTTTGNPHSWENRMWQDRRGSTYDGFINADSPAKAAIEFCNIYENPEILCPETHDYLDGKGTVRNHRITAAETAYERFYNSTR